MNVLQIRADSRSFRVRFCPKNSRNTHADKRQRSFLDPPSPAKNASIGTSNLHPDNADVIRKGLALGMLADIAQHPVEEFLWNQRSVTTGSRTEPLFSEGRAGRILHLEKSISEKHNEIVFRHRTRCRWVA